MFIFISGRPGFIRAVLITANYAEGQSKAAFEDCETERKTNYEEIQKINKDISLLVVDLKERTEVTASLNNFNKRLESLIGPFHGKTIEEITALVDLQIINKSKLFNVVQYKIKKREFQLAELAKEYQILLLDKSQKEVLIKVDKPAKKATRELQNSIHAVEVQLREANHIAIRYKDIKKSLQKDSARFESNIKKIEKDLETQNGDMHRLQQILNDATRMRGAARGRLLHEEKMAMSSSHTRERQSTEGCRLVNSRKQELEQLEKRIFQGGKAHTRMNAATGEDAVLGTDDESPETPSLPSSDSLSDQFELLKQATGATNSDEVLHQFSSQKETNERLVLLRKKSEAEKAELEKELEVLNSQLEHYKYAEVKENERKSTQMEKIEEQILEERKRSESALLSQTKNKKTMLTILDSLRALHNCVNPLAIPGDFALNIIKEIGNDLNKILEKIHNDEENAVTIEGFEERWLPAPYSGLVRRTPLPQPGISPAPPAPQGSDDEEEVPSRTYLKRQAQLVVDAKSRRKNNRIRH